MSEKSKKAPTPKLSKEPPPEVLTACQALAGGVVPDAQHRRIATAVLRSLPGFSPHEDFKVELLARETWLQLRQLMGRVWQQDWRGANDLGMLPEDWFALAFMEQTGPGGREVAGLLREAAAERWQSPNFEFGQKGYIWRNWHRGDFPSTTVSIAAALSKAIWLDVVEPQLKRTPCPAVTTSVLDAAVATLWRDGTNVLWTHRVLRWLVGATFVNQLSSEREDVVKVVGGLHGLATKLQLKPTSAAHRLGQALDLLQNTDMAPEVGPWLRYIVEPSGYGRQAMLKVWPNIALYPDHAVTLPRQNRPQRRAKRLVPLPSTLPPLLGRRTGHGAQCTLELLLLEHFRSQARLVCTKGHVALPDATWRELAKAAGVSTGLLPRLMAAWRCPTPSPNYLLRHKGGDLHTFQWPLRAALDLLKQAAEHEQRGLNAQRRSLSRRRPAEP